ncbi:MAG TPA: hypothetical protein VKP30_30825 [Polyangiaceae bacterium]|nr:hypothetical protein [Polyangiaceae bacterium]
MLLIPSSTPRWLATVTSLFVAWTLASACGGDVGPADGEDSVEATGGSGPNRVTGTTKSGTATITKKGNGGTVGNPSLATGASYGSAQAPAKVEPTGAQAPPKAEPTDAKGSNPTKTTVTVGQGGRPAQEPGKPGSGGTPVSGDTKAPQGGTVAGGPTCRDGVRDGDPCSPTYDLTECVVRTTRVCKCNTRKSAWECRARDENVAGTSSMGGPPTAPGGKPGAGDKHGGVEPVAGQAPVNRAGAGGA